VIDFKTEIQKYKPVLGSDDVDSAANTANYLDEIKDILDILQDIAGQVNNNKD